MLNNLEQSKTEGKRVAWKRCLAPEKKEGEKEYRGHQERL